MSANSPNQWSDAGLARLAKAVRGKAPTADQCACRQAERDNLVSELANSLNWAAGALQTVSNELPAAHELDRITRHDIGQTMTIAQILDKADSLLARVKEQQR